MPCPIVNTCKTHSPLGVAGGKPVSLCALLTSLGRLLVFCECARVLLRCMVQGPFPRTTNSGDPLAHNTLHQAVQAGPPTTFIAFFTRFDPQVVDGK